MYHRAENNNLNRPPLKEALKISARAARPKMLWVAKMTTATMFLVSVLIEVGAFDLLSLHLSGIRNYLSLPAAGLSIVAAQFAGYVPAYTIAGDLLAAGEPIGKVGGGYPDGRKRHHQHFLGLPVVDPLSRRDLRPPDRNGACGILDGAAGLDHANSRLQCDSIL